MASLRFRFFVAICLAVCLILLLRMYFLSIKSNVYFEKIAQRNTEKTEILAPTRGQIFDRRGELLATNELGFSIALSPSLRTKEQLDEELEFIMKFFPQMDKEELDKEYKKEYSPYNHTPITIIPFVKYDEMQKIYPQLLQNPSITISPNMRRNYPKGSLASHIIGYAGLANLSDVEKDFVSKHTKIIGKLGLEKQYNDFLQGDLGSKKTKVNALNKEVELIAETPLQNGGNLRISLDSKIQKILDDEFMGKNGAVVVMDVNNGEILAAGSYPEYDLNDFVGGISHKKWNALLENPYKPLVNKFATGTYPPGSVIKMGIALSFLEYADINEKTVIDTPAFVELGGRKFRDWKLSGHGQSDMIKAIRESVDVYFYLLSQKIGAEKIAHSLKEMGFGEKSGIDLPNESKGIMPTPEWKMRQYGQQWFIGDTVNISIGQGAFLSTPIQIARYTALLASGKLPTPHFVIEKNGEKIKYPPQDVLTPIQQKKLSAITLGMYQVCNISSGTAYKYMKEIKVKPACKTGTAQVVGIPQDIKKRIKEKDMAYFHRSHGWITAFVPYRKPKYAITILVEHGGGSKEASPILVNIVNKMFDMRYFKEIQ